MADFMAKRFEVKTIITDFDETLWNGILAENPSPWSLKKP